MVYITLGVLLFLLIGIGVGAANPDKLKEVRGKYEQKIFEIEGVTGVYDDEVTGQLVVMVEEEKHIKNIPKKFDDVDVEVRVTGKIWALDTEAASSLVLPLQTEYSRTGRKRPVFGGISVGSAGFPNAAGTLGLVVKGKDKNPYVLSNAHVLAMNSNANFLKTGTAVWQPGGADTIPVGYPNPIGKLSKYTSIKFCFLGYYCTPNYADAAIGKLDRGIQYDAYGAVLGEDNTNKYIISGTASVGIEDTVRKSGRTSGVNYGTVQNPSASVLVSYTTYKQALFTDQILTSVMSQPGDSGSAVDKGGKFVGLLFAGSDTITVVCKARYILGPLGVTVS